jgi:hypothetical protein
MVGAGESVVGGSIGLFSGATSAKGIIGGLYDFSRDERQGKWDTTALEDAPSGSFAYAGAKGETTLVTDSGEALLYLRPASDSVYEDDFYRGRAGSFVPVGPRFSPTVVPSAPVNEREQREIGGQPFVAVTPDLTHVLFTIEPLHAGDRDLPPGDTTSLWPGDTTALEEEGASQSLYEYVGVGNTVPILVGVGNAGHPVSDCGTFPGGVQGGAAVTGNHHNAISLDGETVFFTARSTARCSLIEAPALDELFARLHGGQPQSPMEEGRCKVGGDACTVAISEPQALAPAGNEDCTGACAEDTSPANELVDWRNANFEGASADGHEVFFTSAQRLLNQAVQDPSEGSNLYEYDFNENPATGKPVGLKLLSGGDSSGLGPGVQGVAMVSEDGSHVYFVAHGVLTESPRGGAGGNCLAELTVAQLDEEESSGEGQCRPKKGQDNLYVYDTSTGTEEFVGTLNGETDSAQWSADGREAIDVTGNDRFAVFTSTAHLTSDDTGSVQQVFRYDAATGALVRVSIGDEGFNHNGNLSVGVTKILRGEKETAGAEEIAFDLHQAVSEEGIVVFTSTVALTPGAFESVCFATNEEGKCEEDAENVYEYREGRVYLISYGGPTTGISGGSAAISASGDDIYFQSTEQLTPGDTDTLPDIYDARADGGFPAATSPPACSGEGCKAAVVPTAPSNPRGSAVFSGTEGLPGGYVLPGRPPRKKTATEERAEALKRALSACRRTDRASIRKRKSCEALAQRRYGSKGKPRAKKSGRGTRGT